MSEFRSPTAFAFPASKADCSSPEDCVLFAIKKIQQKLKTKTIMQKTLLEVCFQHFDSADNDWFDGAIQNLTTAGVIINENAALENVAPSYFVKLEKTIVKLPANNEFKTKEGSETRKKSFYTGGKKKKSSNKSKKRN